MINFEVKSKVQTIGTKKGQKVFYAAVKDNHRMTLDEVCDMIVDETSLSRGDVMNTLITLGKLACRSLKKGISIDLGDLGSIRIYFPPKMMDKEEDVTAATLKNPKIIFTPKSKMREAVKTAELSVDNPARKNAKKKEEGGKPGKPEGGEQVTP